MRESRTEKEITLHRMAKGASRVSRNGLKGIVYQRKHEGQHGDEVIVETRSGTTQDLGQ
jgi:hypothetical protein